MNDFFSYLFSLNTRPAWAVGVSLVAAALILASRRRPNVREFWTFLAAGLKFLFVLSLVPAVWRGEAIECRLFTFAPGVDFLLKPDALGLYFAGLASGLWILTSIYSVGYMRGLKEHAQTRYYFSFALCLSATVGLAFAGNLLTFFLFYEMLTLATYPLVVHKETQEAIRAGRVYLAYTLSAGAALLVAVAWTYLLAGRLDFEPGGFLKGLGSPAQLKSLFALFCLGAAVKAGLMPFHAWLPRAMIAPTPVSALLHAVAVVKAGVFAYLRIVGFVFGPSLLSELGVTKILAIVAGVTILAASFVALVQDNLKRRLAFSTVAQLSYIILGAALVTPLAYAGAMIHLMNHAFMKITLFFCAGAIYVQTHRQNISEMAGIGRLMPWTLGAFAVGSLGLAGVPGFSGFVSKFFLARGALAAGEKAFLFVLLISALLNVAYFFPIVFRGFFVKSPDFPSFKEADGKMVAPLVITAAFSVVLGILPSVIDMQMRWVAKTVGPIFGVP